MRRHLPAGLALLLMLSAAFVPPANAAEPPGGDGLSLSVADAVLQSLANNRSLEVQRIVPQIAALGEREAEAAFDTTLDGSLSGSFARSRPAAGEPFDDSDSQALTLAGERLLPTGTTLGVAAEASRSGSADSAATRVAVSLTQALLQGRGTDVNLAEVRQRRLDTALSRAELRAFAEQLVALVEQACWDFVLAGRAVAIVERSLGLAEAQLAEVRERIAVGRLAEVEQAAAEVEVARRREALINARSARDAVRLELLRLVNPPGAGPLDREVRIADVPALPAVDPDPVALHVAVALRRRPELEQARLELERGDLVLVQTRNGLLPRLDFFVSLGASGYAASFSDSLAPDDARDVTAGVTMSLPIGNRAARAADRRAALSRRQAEVSLQNLEQLVEVDVRGAWIEAARLREQVAATGATLRLQQENLRTETEKFRVGKSTAFLVAQAQRDLLEAETDAERAVVGCLKSLVDCYRLEGTLLERRGIAVADR